jgi:hypothetical protein
MALSSCPLVTFESERLGGDANCIALELLSGIPDQYEDKDLREGKGWVVEWLRG